jgi:hypothetical protein
LGALGLASPRHPGLDPGSIFFLIRCKFQITP